MQNVQLGDAEATLLDVINQAEQGEPSIMTRHDRPEGALLSFEEWQRLSQVPSCSRQHMAAPLTANDLPSPASGLRSGVL